MRGAISFVGTSLLAVLVVWGCGDDDPSGSGSSGASGGTSSGGTSSGTSGTGAPDNGGPTLPAAPSCAAQGGAATVSAPTLLRKLKDEGGEGWSASPGI